ncbi:MAG: hypothetical protein ACOX5Z_00210 [Desulfobulbus sp.]|jgi:hypothetical protein
MRFDVPFFILLLLAGIPCHLFFTLIYPGEASLSGLFIVIPVLGIFWSGFIGILRLFFTPWGKGVEEILDAIIEEDASEPSERS